MKRKKNEEENGQGGRQVPRPHTGQSLYDNMHRIRCRCPSYTNLTLIPRRYTRCVKINFLVRRLRKLSYYTCKCVYSAMQLVMNFFRQSFWQFSPDRQRQTQTKLYIKLACRIIDTHRINIGISSSVRPRIICGWVTLSVSMFSIAKRIQLLYTNNRYISKSTSSSFSLLIIYTSSTLAFVTTADR